MSGDGLTSLLAVALVAALAPMVVSSLPGPKVPQVVVLILAGILIGPHVLGLADTQSIMLLSNIGLGFLFLLAGYELDPRLLRERPGRLAMGGWAVSAVVAVGAVAALASFHYVKDFVPIGLALTTTALGTLLPILHDNDMTGGKFGRYVLAAGAVGELFPIVAISLFLTHRAQYVAIASLLGVGVLAIILTTLPRILGNKRLRTLIDQGQQATAQTTLRWSIVLLLVLLVGAKDFGLDVVLGAMLAGMVLRSWTRRMGVHVERLEDKLDAVGYGIFIPLFFVSSGMSLDIHSIIADPIRLLVFFFLLLLVRGLPSLLVYARVLPVRQRVEMTFITATTMPLLIALAEIGLRDGVMLPANAAALVGAGVLSVLCYPPIAVALHKRGKPVTSQPAASQLDSSELGGFPERGDALTDADAHGRGSLARAAAAQLVQQRGTDPRAGAAERMTDGDRAAVDVDPLWVELQLVDDRDSLRGKRLVQLGQLDLVQLPAGPAKHLAHRGHRADAHVVGVHAGRRRADVPGHRRGACCLGGSLGHQQQPGRAVVQRRGVAAGHRPASAERGPFGSQLGQRQRRIDALVGCHSRHCGGTTPRSLHRHDLGVEPARRRGCCGPLVAGQRELVLPFPGDAVPVSHVLGCLAQADRRVQLLHLRADQPPAEPGVSKPGFPGERFSGPWQHERRPGHRLGAAGQADVCLARGDGTGGIGDRLEA
jgi:Kef-type K+ transport system membrane component KefB